MHSSIISALAALAGAITGGLTSVLASWLTQHAQARAQWLADDKLRRQELYREFVDTASKCYIHALQYDKANTPALVELFVRVSRMRILSSPKVVESAELVARRIVDTYLEPNKTFLERFPVRSSHCRSSRGLMVRDARRRAPHHEGLRPHPEEHCEAMRLEG